MDRMGLILIVLVSIIAVLGVTVSVVVGWDRFQHRRAIRRVRRGTTGRR